MKSGRTSVPVRRDVRAAHVGGRKMSDSLRQTGSLELFNDFVKGLVNESDVGRRREAQRAREGFVSDLQQVRNQLARELAQASESEGEGAAFEAGAHALESLDVLLMEARLGLRQGKDLPGEPDVRTY